MMYLKKDKLKNEGINNQIHFFNNFILNSDHIICIVERNGIIKTINPAFEKFTGYNQQQLKGFSFFNLLEGVKGIEEKFKDINKYPFSFQSGIRKLNGETEQQVSWNIAFNAYQNLFYGMGTPLLDKDSSSKIKKNEVSEDLLKGKELGDFLYKISHDLKGPTISMSSLLEIAKEEITDQATLKYFSMLEYTTRKLENTLNGLLDLTRIQTSSEYTRINFKEILAEVLKRYESEIPENLKIEINIQEGIQFDSQKVLLQIMISHLISNSIQYRKRNLKDSYIKILISQNKDKVLIIVEDNGIGIDKGQSEKVFEMFYKGSEYSKGNGLGLFLVKKAMEKLKGSIDLISNKEAGARIELSFPVKK